MSRNIPQAMSWELDATPPLVEDPRVRPTARSNGGRIVGWPQADGGEVFVAANPSGVSLQFDLEPKVGVVLHHVSNSVGHVERSRARTQNGPSAASWLRESRTFSGASSMR